MYMYTCNHETNILAICSVLIVAMATQFKLQTYKCFWHKVCSKRLRCYHFKEGLVSLGHEELLYRNSGFGRGSELPLNSIMHHYTCTYM